MFTDITMRVGDPVDVSDLITNHENEHGPLWKYSAAVARGGADDEVNWDVLYGGKPEDGRRGGGEI